MIGLWIAILVFVWLGLLVFGEQFQLTYWAKSGDVLSLLQGSRLRLRVPSRSARENEPGKSNWPNDQRPTLLGACRFLAAQWKKVLRALDGCRDLA